MRRMAFLTRFLVVLACLAAGGVRAEENEVRQATLRAAEDGLVLDAEISFALTPRLAEVLAPQVLRAFSPRTAEGRLAAN